MLQSKFINQLDEARCFWSQFVDASPYNYYLPNHIQLLRLQNFHERKVAPLECSIGRLKYKYLAISLIFRHSKVKYDPYQLRY